MTNDLQTKIRVDVHEAVHKAVTRCIDDAAHAAVQRVFSRAPIEDLLARLIELELTRMVRAMEQTQ